VVEKKINESESGEVYIPKLRFIWLFSYFSIVTATRTRDVIFKNYYYVPTKSDVEKGPRVRINGAENGIMH